MKNKSRYMLSAAFMAAAITFGGMGDGARAQAQGKAPPAPAAPVPIPQDDANALIKAADLRESPQAVKELVPGWTKPKAFLVAVDEPGQVAWLQQAVPGVKIIVAPHGSRGAPVDWSKVPGITDVAGAIGVSPSAGLLAAAKNLKWFHALATGVENQIEVPEIAKGKFLLTNSPASIIPQVADNAIGMAVALMRGLDVFVKMAQTKHMVQPDFGTRGWQIEGRTLLVVGLGGLGNQIAAMAYGLGMKVIATRASSHSGPPYVDYVGLSNELPDLLGKADVVVVATPLTAETKGMFNAAMFARMKKGGIFINVARGEEVVQSDLVAALHSGQVGAAGLEVTEIEPLPDGDPLWDAPNTIIMTHFGTPAIPPDGVDTYRQKEWIIARDEMRRYAAGEKMLNVVDVKRGY